MKISRKTSDSLVNLTHDYVFHFSHCFRARDARPSKFVHHPRDLLCFDGVHPLGFIGFHLFTAVGDERFLLSLVATCVLVYVCRYCYY